MDALPLEGLFFMWSAPGSSDGQGVKVPPGQALSSPVAKGHCAAARRGGKHREANDPSVGDELDSAVRFGEPATSSVEASEGTQGGGRREAQTRGGAARNRIGKNRSPQETPEEICSRTQESRATPALPAPTIALPRQPPRRPRR